MNKFILLLLGLLAMTAVVVADSDSELEMETDTELSDSDNEDFDLNQDSDDEAEENSDVSDESENSEDSDNEDNDEESEEESEEDEEEPESSNDSESEEEQEDEDDSSDDEEGEQSENVSSEEDQDFESDNGDEEAEDKVESSEESNDESDEESNIDAGDEDQESEADDELLLTDEDFWRRRRRGFFRRVGRAFRKVGRKIKKGVSKVKKFVGKVKKVVGKAKKFVSKVKNVVLKKLGPVGKIIKKVTSSKLFKIGVTVLGSMTGVGLAGVAALKANALAKLSKAGGIVGKVIKFGKKVNSIRKGGLKGIVGALKKSKLGKKLLNGKVAGWIKKGIAFGKKVKGAVGNIKAKLQGKLAEYQGKIQKYLKSKLIKGSPAFRNIARRLGGAFGKVTGALKAGGKLEQKFLAQGGATKDQIREATGVSKFGSKVFGQLDTQFKQEYGKVALQVSANRGNVAVPQTQAAPQQPQQIQQGGCGCGCQSRCGC
eukprot:TRINITY_DN4783_c0_g1_i2.p2 TRINITY_DN4783_c0_g1~~TRINITY_DN4783_c0_g1_i2.p2  ORF type:complete len:497 (+),score=231.04 TRINITY_DN4783_c0_g1_i2:32-1492(+)